MNKKGIFFTILAVAILSLFLVSYTTYSSAQERKAVEKRILTLNNLIFSVEKDLPRQVYISGFRIIIFFEKKITVSGASIPNFDSAFNEIFFNETFNGGADPELTDLMQEATFLDINKHLQEAAAKINAFANLTNPSLNVSQDDPWNVKVTLTADLLVKDNSNLASWNRTAKIVAYIPIENFDDPFYTIGTRGLVTNKINKTAYSVPIALSNLQNHAGNSYYIAHSDAPSFLKRFKGEYTGDVNGIESLVNTKELGDQFISQPEYGLSVLDKSVVDYIYFDPLNSGQPYSTPLGNWIKIDDNHCSVSGGPYSCS